MSFCRFCGTKLEDGQQCTCKAAQEAAKPSAVKRPIMTPEQKEAAQHMAGEMKKIASDVAKGALSQSKEYFSSQREAAAKAPAALYRKIMMAFGAAQILFFFILSYGKLDSAGSAIKSAAKMIGLEIPRRLTGPSVIQLMNACAEYGIRGAEEAHMEFMVLFGLPVVCGILLIVLNLKEKPGGMVSSIIPSVLTLLSYLTAYIGLSGNIDQLGYKLGLGFGFVFVVTALQIAAAVMGHIAGTKAKAAA